MAAATRSCWLPLAAVLLWLAAPCWAEPRLGYVYPAGARQGATVRVILGGSGFKAVSLLADDGVTAKLVEVVPAITSGDIRDARAVIEARLRSLSSGQPYVQPVRNEKPVVLRDLPPFRSLDTKSADDLRHLLADLTDPKRQPNAQLAEQIIADLTVAEDAPPGYHELRVVGADGASNPLSFEVGVLPETNEDERSSQVTVTTPAVINGQIMPGDADHFAVSAKKGQHLVVVLQARRLIPYLADAVPGWFQAVLELRDAEGRTVAYDDDFMGEPDPILHLLVRSDGTYTLTVRDALWRGREDFVYRLAAGELPLITSHWPLGGREGGDLRVQPRGWNLNGDQLLLDSALGFGRLRMHEPSGQWLTHPLRYALDNLPERDEGTPDASLDQPTAVQLPLTINGHIGRPGDVDVFAFDGHAGQRLVAEVMARRLGSPLDSALRLIGPDGALLAANDDFADPAEGLLTHQADSYLLATLPSPGRYRVVVVDSQGGGGDEYAYRLRLGAPRPDFDLRTTRSGLQVAAGSSVPLTVRAIRRDGYDGPIGLALSDAPPGYSLSGGVIPAGADHVTVTIDAPRTLVEEPLALGMVGLARDGQLQVIRAVQPADDVMQAFLYRHLAPARHLLLLPGRTRPALPPLELPLPPVRLPTAGVLTVALPTAKPWPEHVRCQLVEGPAGLTLEAATVQRGSLALRFAIGGRPLVVGASGNLIVQVDGESKDAQSGKTNRWRIGYLPALTYTVAEG